jgi:molecular chaperone GrpE (heat shock protein)
MLKKCAILGLIVLSMGGIALAWGHYRMQAQQPKVSRSGPPKGSLRSPEYGSKYSRWYELRPEEQTRLVLELDVDRRSKTPELAAQEQRDRLHADIDRLAAGETVPSEIVTYLYGPNWQDEIARYKAQVDQTRSIQAASVICASFGAGLFLLSGLGILGHSLVRATRKAGTSDVESEATAEPPAASDPIQTDDHPTQAESETSSSESEVPDCGKPRKRAQRPSVAVEPLQIACTNEPVRALDCDFEAERAKSEAESSVAVQTLNDEAEGLQRQIAEFRAAAESIQEAAGRSEPLSDTLKELTEQVSAIRDYAVGQQDHLKKLQDGYDWGIIRTFCLRVIRCVDNIEGRIEELRTAGESVELLEDIRDELLFALESSGVEQFEPEFGSDYHGQEKFSEAIKEKETSGRPDQAGTIAKVLRPGYRYVMDEGNFKIVRTAQVMLFGCEHE